MMEKMTLTRWQAAYRACPAVFGVYVRCGGEETLNSLYDSEEAANLERDWLNSRSKNGYYGKAFVRRHHVANLELARDRFRSPTTHTKQSVT